LGTVVIASSRMWISDCPGEQAGHRGVGNDQVGHRADLKPQVGVVDAGEINHRVLAGFLWGGWLLVTTVVFSYTQGIWHPYYTTMLSPAIAPISAAGLVRFFGRRPSPTQRQETTTTPSRRRDHPPG
jgi:hypothetical protein